MFAIQRIIAARNIQVLTHFTRLSNLDSILTRGLLTKSSLARDGVACEENDTDRFDQTDAICATISFPNYKMWYQLRSDRNNANVKWAVVVLRASVLWQRDCVFSSTNAAAAEVSSASLELRRGAKALESMFDDYGEKKRDSLGIPAHFTTNPQAEVLIMNGVPSQLIRAVAFNDKATTAHYSQKYPKLDCRTLPGLWNGRSDWPHWKKA